jgi:hypothetical protein
LKRSIITGARYALSYDPPPVAPWSRLSLLERAEALLRQGLPAERWPDAELEAFVRAHCADLMHLSDAELEAMIAENGEYERRPRPAEGVHHR